MKGILTFLVGAALLGACRPAPKPAPPESPAVGRGPVIAVRGDARFAEAAVSFTPCAASRSVALVDSTGGVLAEVRRGSGSSAEQWYLELDGVRTDTSFTALRVRRANAGEGIGCGQPTITSRYVAHGTEPFWAIEVTDSTIIYRSPEHLDGLVFTGQGASTDSVGVFGWGGARSGGEPSVITVQFRPAACRDGMSGEYFGWTAAVVLGDRALHGCAAMGFPREAP